MSTAIMQIQMLKPAFVDSLKKLNPLWAYKNPVMFIVYLGAAGLSFLLPMWHSSFNIQIVLWLWFTVLFANFAEALAENRGKAQAAALRKLRVGIKARKLTNNIESLVTASLLQPGDLVVCEAGNIIPGDGEVVEGIASVDESAITGESAPVIRESGGDRSAVTGGTKVLSDRIIVKITSETGKTFIDRMISLVEGSKRQKTPNEIALNILLLSLTALFLVVVVTFPGYIIYSNIEMGKGGISQVSVFVLVSLLVCLIPTTIGGLLSAIGISGIDRLIQRNVLATSGRAVEAAGDVDVLLLDKTGTITFGNRQAVEFIPAPGVSADEMAHAAQLSSLADETPEGRSIVVFAKKVFNLRGVEVAKHNSQFVPFSATTRMSGVDMYSDNGELITIRKGAIDAIKDFIESQKGKLPAEVKQAAERIALQGGTPLVVAENGKALGVIHLKDIVKGGIKERFMELRRMGIRTIMVTGDNPLTAAAIAAEAGVDDFMAEAKPEEKLARIRAEQQCGHLVAMTGDGTNDAPALAQADVGVAMNSGTQAAREAGNMVDLDSDPTKLIDIVAIGKQLLMTRGSLTTFSIANDVAKYFAIIPAVCSGIFIDAHGHDALNTLNMMRLYSPQTAVLSAIIFNALIIIALIPLALRGVHYIPKPANVVLRNNIIVYGLGGLVSPFIGIKLIDIILSLL